MKVELYIYWASLQDTSHPHSKVKSIGKTIKQVVNVNDNDELNRIIVSLSKKILQECILECIDDCWANYKDSEIDIRITNSSTGSVIYKEIHNVQMESGLLCNDLNICWLNC